PDKFGILGVSTDAGRAYFGYFLCTSKESNWPPGHSRPKPVNWLKTPGWPQARNFAALVFPPARE
ncbi:MAG: hypothetical protein WC474_10170, partial [Hydrogenophilaceae bacterium]